LGHTVKGTVLIYSGRPKEGLAAVEIGARLDPRSPWRALGLLRIAVGHYFCRDYEPAVEAARQVIRSYPDWPLPYRWLAGALGQLGRTEEAKRALDKGIAMAPIHVPFLRPEDHAHMLEGLRKAGWREE
jgi:adenylate cyclase